MRLTTAQLDRLRSQLTTRDERILSFMRKLRYMKTDHVRRLFYPQSDTDTLHACKVRTMKNLNRLMEWGLIARFEKRVGGVRAGSEGIIWYVTEAGARLLVLGTEFQNQRKRLLEPLPNFMRHTLAVTETFVRIVEICQDDPVMKLKHIEVEPSCWREYRKGDKTMSLRPDLYARTVTGEYFDHMFIEMDLSTEPPFAVVEKCRRYHDYYKTGAEQKKSGAFPLVVWIVPDEARKQRLEEEIRFAFKNRYPRIFLFILDEELESVLRDGADKEKLC